MLGSVAVTGIGEFMPLTLPHYPRFALRLELPRALPLTLLLCTAPSVEADAFLAAPLGTRNLSPLYMSMGVPRLQKAFAQDLGQWDLDLVAHWASHSVQEEAQGRFLELDGETRRYDLRASWQTTERLTLAVNVPFVEHTGGQLDSLIDGWHAFWGLPDGPREIQPQDRLNYEYVAGSALNLSDDVSGLGDVELDAQYTLFSRGGVGSGSALSVFASYKFDSGDLDDLTGSGDDALAIGLRWSGNGCLFESLTCHVQAGYAQVAALPIDEGADDDAWFGAFGLAWSISDSWALIAQAEAQGAVYQQQPLAANNAPVWGSLGLRWRINEHWLVDGSFTEDLAVGASPDVSFQFGLRWVP